VKQASKPASPITKDPLYPRLKSFVIETTGMVFFADKDDDLVRIFDKRFKDTKTDNCSSYLELLSHPEAGKKEQDELIGELTIGETYFFRHSEQFDALRQTVLPEIIKKNTNTRRLRIWSAGCATGAEPYTLAMVLNDFSRTCSGFNFSVLATDISSRVLDIAIRGVYDAGEIDPVPMGLRKKYLMKNKDKTKLLVRIVPELRKKVRFQHLNLMDNDF